jgi:hypothetical protein
MLIDVAIPGDRNVIKKKAEKILEYRHFITEIQRMWNVKAKVISVTTGATGTISKSLRLHMNNIRRKHEIKELQTTAVLGTAHAHGRTRMHAHTHTMESANVKVQNTFHGRNNTTRSTSVNTYICNTISTRIKVCFRYMIVNTLHKFMSETCRV